MRFSALILLLSPLVAFGHANLTPAGNIPARSAATGLKVGPCGNVARTANPKILQAGSTVVVDWQETIQHPGYYEFFFSPAGDTNWVNLKTVTDTQDATNDLPHRYQTTLTLPNTPCDACTLQMIQVMTENPANPTNYYSCADIRLTAAPGATPAPSPTPAKSGATPTPTPPCD